ncbi:MAG: type II secretion system F family protein [bacterium]|nr:type II secretion system F family protein [bacterium]
MIYYYQAIDNDGSKMADYIDAPSPSAARQKVKNKGLFIISLEEHDVTQQDKKKTGTTEISIIKNVAEKISDSLSARSSVKQVGLFSRQLATLLRAGLPLTVAIADIIDQIDNKHFRNVVADIRGKIEEGSSFSNALERHRTIFSDMYINMVRVGENLGSLDEVIERLAEMEEKTNTLKSKVKSAMYYPAFMFLFAMGVATFLLVNVIPAIIELFEDQARELPVPTKIVVAISNFISGYWFVIPIVLIFTIYGYNRYAKTHDGRRKIDEIKLKLPLIKSLYKKMLVFRVTQNLGILLNNKVDILRSFEIVQKVVDNIVIEEELAEASTKIKEGSTVSKALQQSQFLPKLVLGMINAGEASDQLDKMLLNIGRVYENEVDLAVSGLTSLLEPLIIIFMGVIIGTIVMSVMLPMMDMSLMTQ